MRNKFILKNRNRNQTFIVYYYITNKNQNL